MRAIFANLTAADFGLRVVAGIKADRRIRVLAACDAVIKAACEIPQDKAKIVRLLKVQSKVIRGRA